MPYTDEQFNAVVPEVLAAIRHQHPTSLDDFDPASGAGQLVISLSGAMTSQRPYHSLPGLDIPRITRQLKRYFKKSDKATLRHIISPRYGFEHRSGGVSGYNYNFIKVVFDLKG